MVRAVKGVLLTCDPAVKQLILTLNERPNNAFESAGATAYHLRTPFLVEDLDETHVLVAAESVLGLKAELEHELEKNTFAQDMS